MEQLIPSVFDLFPGEGEKRDLSPQDHHDGDDEDTEDDEDSLDTSKIKLPPEGRESDGVLHIPPPEPLDPDMQRRWEDARREEPTTLPRGAWEMKEPPKGE